VTATTVTTHDLWVATSKERDDLANTVADLRQQVASVAEALEADLVAVSRQFDNAVQAGAAMAGELAAVARVLDDAGAPGVTLADRVIALATSRQRLARSMAAAIDERDQYRRDRDATSGRAAELAARVSELEGDLARATRQRGDAEVIARNALAAGDTQAGALRSRVTELEADRGRTARAAEDEAADDRANGIGAS
jgi:chromosome segregation ATPase